MLVKLPREALQVAFLLVKKQAIFEGYINIETTRDVSQRWVLVVNITFSRHVLASRT